MVSRSEKARNLLFHNRMNKKKKDPQSGPFFYGRLLTLSSNDREAVSERRKGTVAKLDLAMDRGRGGKGADRFQAFLSSTRRTEVFHREIGSELRGNAYRFSGAQWCSPNTEGDRDVPKPQRKTARPSFLFLAKKSPSNEENGSWSVSTCDGRI